MYTIHKLLNCTVEVDREATSRWYTQAEDWGCQCGDCQKFVAMAKENLLPDRVRELLDLLEVPPSKVTYVSLLDGRRLYQFSYRIAGNILSADSPMDPLGRCCHETYPYGAPDFPTPHFDLEFFAEL